MKEVQYMFRRVEIQKMVILLFLFLISGNVAEIKAQKVVLKANMLSWMTTTVNAGAELKIAPQWSAEINVMYKAWNLLPDNKKMEGLLIQPEVRYWLCQPFYHDFIGFHIHYGQYNGGFDKFRYQGDLFGAGVSYGYQWILGQKWNLEMNVGLGYARMNYDKYERPTCGLFLGKDSKNYLGITKIGVSLIYILK